MTDASTLKTAPRSPVEASTGLYTPAQRQTRHTEVDKGLQGLTEAAVNVDMRTKERWQYYGSR